MDGFWRLIIFYLGIWFNSSGVADTSFLKIVNDLGRKFRSRKPETIDKNFCPLHFRKRPINSYFWIFFIFVSEMFENYASVMYILREFPHLKTEKK